MILLEETIGKSIATPEYYLTKLGLPGLMR